MPDHPCQGDYLPGHRYESEKAPTGRTVWRILAFDTFKNKHSGRFGGQQRQQAYLNVTSQPPLKLFS